MKRLIAAAAISALFTLGGASIALGQSERAIERSGNTFHVKACPEHGQPGVARCHAHIVTDANGRPVNPNGGKPNFGFQGYFAQDLRNAYGVTGFGSGATTIAIVDANGYANAEADLAVYRSTMGLPACTTANGCFTKVNQTGGTNYPAANTGWAQEQALDLDMVSAICPGCNILLVQASSANFSDIMAAVQYAGDHAQIVSNSYGATEFSGAGAYSGPYNKAGVTMTVSSGDSGYGVQFPADLPSVVAVGGTSLNLSGGVFSESAWSGAGSGCSALFTKAPYQSIPAGCNMRMVADVSAVADPNTGVRVYGPTSSTTSGWMIFGGTSAAAPIIAGVYGVNGATGAPSNPYLFGNGSNLHDVTSGANGRCRGAPNYFCNAGSGYDGPTGLGTPKGGGAF
jgi:hypothetical protein